MPNFPIIDTHLHIWNTEIIQYPWLADIPLLNKPHLIEDYRTACGETQVEKMVFVQAEAAFALFREEVDWVSSVAENDQRIQAIVAWAPLEAGSEAEKDVADLANNPLVKGIRRIIQFESDPEFCLRPGFIEGVRLLPKYGLTFDICINHEQMENTIKFVEKCPEVSFILDHIGKPDIKNRRLDPWRSNLKVFSDFPNVWCKMSGLVTEANHASWTKEDLKPYVDHVLTCFGFEKTMYGGDWPVASQAATYGQWLHALEWAIDGASESDRRQLFRENAASFYRFSAPQSAGRATR